MDAHFITGQPDVFRNQGDLYVVPRGLETWEGDWWERYFPDLPCTHVTAYHVYDDPIHLPSGRPMCYHWELAGSGGASFRLFRLPEHTDEDVKHAIAWLRRTRDVVRASVFRARSVRALI